MLNCSQDKTRPSALCMASYSGWSSFTWRSDWSMKALPFKTFEGTSLQSTKRSGISRSFFLICAHAWRVKSPGGRRITKSGKSITIWSNRCFCHGTNTTWNTCPNDETMGQSSYRLLPIETRTVWQPWRKLSKWQNIRKSFLLVWSNKSVLETAWVMWWKTLKPR